MVSWTIELTTIRKFNFIVLVPIALLKVLVRIVATTNMLLDHGFDFDTMRVLREVDNLSIQVLYVVE